MVDNPIIEEKTPVKEEPAPVVEEENNLDSSHSYWWLWLLVGVLACVISFAGGYIFGRHMDRNRLFDSESTKPDSVVVAPAPVVIFLKPITLNLASSTVTGSLLV